MLDNQSSLLGETVSIHLRLHVGSRVHVYIYAIAQKLSIFLFLEFSVMSVHRNYFTGKKIKLLAGFELASSILGVLGLAHYTIADDIVILHRYDTLNFRKPNSFPYIWRKLSMIGLRYN